MGGQVNFRALEAVAMRLAPLQSPLTEGEMIQFDLAAKPLPKLPSLPTKQKPTPGGNGWRGGKK